MSLVRFDELKPALRAESLAVLAAQGFATATPVQAAVIPLLTTNKDVAVEACTGSGKTLAFVLPLVEILARLDDPLTKHKVGAVIVSPTRELAKQIFDVAAPYLVDVCVAPPMLLVGGSDPRGDVDALRQHGANLLVGTPGRLHDVMERTEGFLQFKSLELLILDEADRLLGMGFQKQLSSIMKRLPKQRRTGLFSATQTEAVEELARAGLRNAVRVAVKQGGGGGGAGVGGRRKGTKADVPAGESKTPSQLCLEYSMCEADVKIARFVRFLTTHANRKVIVYFLTCACVDFFVAVLPHLPTVARAKLRLFALHGRMKQSAREQTLGDYTATTGGACLLCTDLAARGLDIPDVDWVVQYDPPQDPAAFVHRVGRTARMGRDGNALVYLLPHEEAYVDFLHKRQVPLQLAADADDTDGGEDAVGAVGAREMCEGARVASEKDRDVMEKGTRAFMSCVRAYKEHQCNFIFRMAKLDLGKLATSFGLLYMPKMKETKHSKVPIVFRPSRIHADDVKYKDKSREKQRQRNLKERAAREEAEAAAEEEAERARRKLSKDKADATVEQQKKTAAKRRQHQEQQDHDELQEEYRLLKKLRNRKISEAEYEAGSEAIMDSHMDVAVKTDKKQTKAAKKKLEKNKRLLRHGR